MAHATSGVTGWRAWRLAAPGPVQGSVTARKVSISIFVDPNKIRRQIDRGNLTARPYGGPDRPEQSFDLIDKTQAVLLANKKELQ